MIFLIPEDRIVNTVREKFRGAARDYDMFGGTRGILVGYSGGADSTLLLRLLYEYREKTGVYLKAVHVNHMIRGAEAERDAEHCREMCRDLSIDFELVKEDIPARAARLGKGTEETARDFRYETFERILSSDDRLDRVATAHNADDNAETVLFNLTRGTGVDGLSGIPPVRRLANGLVVRPLIYARKSEISDACKALGAEYVVDSTNNDTVYTRNYLRHEVIPALEKINPALVDSISRLSAAAKADSDYLRSLSEQLAGQADVRGGRVSIPAELIVRAPLPTASRAVIALFAKLSEKTLSAKQVNAVLSVSHAAKDAFVSLPDEITARNTKRGGVRYVEMYRGEAVALRYRFSLKEGLNYINDADSAVYMLSDGQKCEEIQKNNDLLKNVYKSSILTELNSDKINHILFVRSRRNGDSYVYGGMTRKLKKLYNDRGLGASERESLPIIEDAEGILWVPGFPAADRAAYPKEFCGAMPKKTILIYYYN